MTDAMITVAMLALCVCFQSVLASVCPESCYCNQKKVDCVTQMEFPTNLAEDTEVIKVSHLNIRDLPPRVFSRYPNLTEVEIINSNIANIQGCAFSEMPSIQNIYIDKTVIGNVESYAFMGLSNLTFIKFSKSRIGRLKEFAFYSVSDIDTFLFIEVHIQNFYTHALYNFTNVEFMIWNQNNISDFVTGSLAHVSGIKQFECNSNAFWNMHCGVMSEIETMSEKLIFTGNTFYCNCSAYWLLNDTGRQQFSWLLPKTRCHGPDDLKERPALSDVMFKELGCRSIESLTPTSCKKHAPSPQPVCPVPGPWSTWVTQPTNTDKGGNSSHRLTTTIWTLLMTVCSVYYTILTF